MDSKQQLKPRVFITNYAGHTYEGAHKYGDFVYLTKGYISFKSLDRIKFTIAEQIINESTAEDWLLLSGVPALSAIAAALWMAHHGQVKLLVWDKKYKDHYRELEITPQNMLEMTAAVTEDESGA